MFEPDDSAPKNTHAYALHPLLTSVSPTDVSMSVGLSGPTSDLCNTLLGQSTYVELRFSLKSSGPQRLTLTREYQVSAWLLRATPSTC